MKYGLFWAIFGFVICMGMPTVAHSQSRQKQGVPMFYETVFEFDQPGLAVSAGGGVMSPFESPIASSIPISAIPSPG